MDHFGDRDIDAFEAWKIFHPKPGTEGATNRFVLLRSKGWNGYGKGEVVFLLREENLEPELDDEFFETGEEVGEGIGGSMGYIFLVVEGI